MNFAAQYATQCVANDEQEPIRDVGKLLAVEAQAKIYPHAGKKESQPHDSEQYPVRLRSDTSSSASSLQRTLSSNTSNVVSPVNYEDANINSSHPKEAVYGTMQSFGASTSNTVSVCNGPAHTVDKDLYPEVEEKIYMTKQDILMQNTNVNKSAKASECVMLSPSALGVISANFDASEDCEVLLEQCCSNNLYSQSQCHVALHDSSNDTENAYDLTAAHKFGHSINRSKMAINVSG